MDMERHYLLEDRETGEIVVCDGSGKEQARFIGDAAVHQAIRWAQAKGLDLYSSKDPDELSERHRFLFRRGLRLFRVGRNHYNPVNRSQDPPNVARIVVDEDDPWSASGDVEDTFPDENIELAPRDSED